MSDVARTRRLRALQAEWVYLDSTINDPAARIYGDCARELLAVLDTEEDRQERANCSIHPTGDHEWVCLTCLETTDEPSKPIADTEGDRPEPIALKAIIAEMENYGAGPPSEPAHRVWKWSQRLRALTIADTEGDASPKKETRPC